MDPWLSKERARTSHVGAAMLWVRSPASPPSPHYPSLDVLAWVSKDASILSHSVGDVNNWGPLLFLFLLLQTGILPFLLLCNLILKRNKHLGMYCGPCSRSPGNIMVQPAVSGFLVKNSECQLSLGSSIDCEAHLDFRGLKMWGERCCLGCLDLASHSFKIST